MHADTNIDWTLPKAAFQRACKPACWPRCVVVGPAPCVCQMGGSTSVCVCQQPASNQQPAARKSNQEYTRTKRPLWCIAGAAGLPTENDGQPGKQSQAGFSSGESCAFESCSRRIKLASNASNRLLLLLLVLVWPTNKTCVCVFVSDLVRVLTQERFEKNWTEPINSRRADGGANTCLHRAQLQHCRSRRQV